MKKGFGIAALALATGCAVIFAGCTGCNGCGANEKKNEAAFSSNWYADTNYRYIQPTFNESNEAFKGKEVITYTVKHDTQTAGNSTYSVEYAEGGTYKTEFYATTLNKTLIDEEYRGTYPEEDIAVYCYKTELVIPGVTFKLKSDTTAVQVFDEGESTVTECYFLDVNNHLRPVYSKITTKGHAPADYQVSTLDGAYKTVDETATTSYKYDGSMAKTVVVDNVNHANDKVNKVGGLGDTDNSLADVCGLNIAVRAMQLGSSLSQVISVYSPAGKMQNYTFAGSSYDFGNEERKSYEDILAGKELYVSGEGKSLSTVCVTTTLNADMKGASQKYWFAAIDNLKNNKGRATMVKMSFPLSFSLGTLNYSLETITSTLY